MSHAQTKPSSEQSSLLSESSILGMLAEGRKNLEKDGSLVPLLIIELGNGQSFMSQLQIPDDSAAKYGMFKAIRQQIRTQAGAIKDALLIVETWFVTQDTPDSTKYMPSQHPSRQEAIVIMGRNAEKTRSALVIQSFTRNEHNALVWSNPMS